MSLTPVDNRRVAAIVTHLEMRQRPRPAPLPFSPLRLVPWRQPTLDLYRALFRRVGEPWLWFSRLVMSDVELATIIHNPDVAIYAVVDPQGIEVGLLELDFRGAGECELAFLGLIPDLTGKGHGKWLLAQAKALAWRKDVTRFWVHTCTLDSPGALGFYIKGGFAPFAREVEIFADPRVSGHLSREAAPHVPILDQAASA